MSYNFLKIIQKYGKKNPEIIVRYIDTFQKLQIYNIEFLKGNINRSFYWGVPVYEENKNIINNLIELNKSGFITSDFETGKCTYSRFVDHTWLNYKGEIEGNWFVDSEEKPYITGYIKKDLIKKLDQYIRESPILKNIVFHVPYYLFNKDMEYEKGDVINLRKNKAYYKLEDQNKTEWENESHFFYNDDFNGYSIIEEYYHNLKPILKDYVYCTIFINEYCTRIDLFRELLKFFKKPSFFSYAKTPMIIKVKRSTPRKIKVKSSHSKKKK